MAVAKTPVVKAKRKPNPALMQPMMLSEALQAIVGIGPMPRSEVVKKIWDYIKENGLQDDKNKRMINPDAKLATILGNKQIIMFDMTKKVSEHILGAAK